MRLLITPRNASSVWRLDLLGGMDCAVLSLLAVEYIYRGVTKGSKKDKKCSPNVYFALE